MFEQLSDKLENTFKKLRGRGKLSESNIKEAVRELKLSLLEADVNYKVVKEIVAKVKERAVGKEVLKSITPGQQFVKIFHDELVEILGEGDHSLNVKVRPPAIVLMAGLQGSGKTTSSAKLANYLKKKQKKSVLLVPADVYRPAAIEQLKKLGETVGVEVFDSSINMNPVDIAKKSVEYAKNQVLDVVIIDTAGRLHNHQNLSNELKKIVRISNKAKKVLLIEKYL